MTSEPSSSLSAQAARNLANTTKTPPQMAGITPRWLLRLLPWVDVEAGTFRVNRVRVVGEEFEKVITRIEGDEAVIEPGDLRSVPIFRDMSDELAGRVVAEFRTVQVERGEEIVQEGDEADAFFVVAAGKVEIFTRGFTSDVVLALLGPGSYFGEIGLIGTRRMASARARVPSVLLRLDRARFRSLLDEFPGFRDAIEATIAERVGGQREVPIDLTTPVRDEDDLLSTFVDYDLHPQEQTLAAVQTILRAHTRVTDLFRSPMDQLKEQLRLVLEACREKQEWELVNHPSFGLLPAAAPSMRVTTRSGPPTPDDMDELLSMVWKEPAFFLAHPKAIAAFGRECTRRGVPPPTVGMFGSQFLTWRGVPLVPSDKLPVGRTGNVPTTNIVLMRVGSERQGVVGLHQPSIGDPSLPSVAIRFNGVDAKGIANYLVSLYFSLAILTPDALGVLENVEIGHYHDPAR